jgi:CRISPR-associated protein Csb2
MSSSNLHISVTFLQPTCHARLGKEDAAPNEWPPSPLRLFQAMVAGAGARWGGKAGDHVAPRGGDGALTAAAPVAALGWLESLCKRSPPTILAPRAVTGQAVPRYVPNNSADLVAAKWARNKGDDALATFEDRTKKVFRPTHLLDGSTVHYLWSLTEDERQAAMQHIRTLTAAARSIVALGWGIDAAIGDARVVSESEAQSLAGERWTPHRVGGRGGSPGLRLPVPGTLDALTVRHAAFLDRLKDGVFRPVPPLHTFITAAYRRACDAPPRPFAAFVLRPIDTDTGYAAFAPTRAVCVAAMLRHAACEASRSDLDPAGWRTNEWSLRFVAGHGPDGAPKRRTKVDAHPRFSYLPLPSIGHAHADGFVRRVIIAEPFGGDGRSASWAAQRLAGAELIDEDSKKPVARLEPVEPDEAEFAKAFRLYAARSANEAAAVWTSITPVILPGFDDNKPAKRERLLLDCLRHAGIDPAAVASVESRRSAWQPHGGGALTQMLSAFKRPTYLKHLPAIHVRLKFSRPISGPIAIGAGRHCGLGVCAIDSLP